MSLIFDIRNYGAIGDAKTDCTAALQAAVDAASAQGGGTVLVEHGTFLFYPFRLKSNVRLEVAWDAVMLAGPDPERYFIIPKNPYWNTDLALRNNRRCVIYAEGAEHIAICGQGRFDFNGTTTAIDNVTISGMEDGAWYTISGIRVNRPAAKGVYIHNGRKVIVK